MFNWEKLADEYSVMKLEERCINLELVRLRELMKEQLPLDVKKIRTSKGNVIRYNSFRKWIYSDELTDAIQKEKDDGIAVKEVGEIVTLILRRDDGRTS